MSYFGIPRYGLLLLGVFHEGHKSAEQIDLGDDSHEYLDGNIEGRFYEYADALVVLLHPGADLDPVGLAPKVPILTVDHRIVVVDQVLLADDLGEDGQFAGVSGPLRLVVFHQAAGQVAGLVQFVALEILQADLKHPHIGVGHDQQLGDRRRLFCRRQVLLDF